jgi:hypothetical protein
VLLLGLVLRILGFVAEPRILNPDETFQYFEQAHRLVFGSGLLPWEFLIGIRSWLLPGVIAGIMEVTKSVSDSPLAYIDLTRLLASIVSLSVVFVGFRVAQRRYGLWAAVLTGGFAAVWFDAIWFASAIMTEVLAAHVALLGYWLAEGTLSEGRVSAGWDRRRLAAAGACSGLAVCLRYQYVPALFAMAAWQNRLTWPRWGWLIAGGLPVLLLGSGLLDWLTFGAPFQTMWLNFSLNTTLGVASSMGSEPPKFYLDYLTVTLLPLAIPLLLGVAAAPALAIGALVTVLMHMAIPHKEARFIYLAIAIAPILIGLGAARLLEPLARRRAVAATMTLAAGAVLAAGAALSAWDAFAGPLTPRWAFQRATVQVFLAARDTPGLCGLGVREVPMFGTGGYTYLHRDVPLYPERFTPVLPLPLAKVPLPETMMFRGRELTQYPGDAFATNASRFNTLIAAPDHGLPGFERSSCYGDAIHNDRITLCLFIRAGGCEAP